MSIQRYQQSKESGVELIGQVPDNWTVALLKRFLTVQSGDMISSSEETETGVPLIGGNGVRAYTSVPNCEGDTLVIGRVGAKCGCVHHIKQPFWASEHAYRVVERRPFSRRYFYHVLNHLNLNQHAITTAQPLLNTTIIESQWVAVPPLEDQYLIAEFLDRETAKIDALVAEQRRLIELLKEKRQAVISHAVTKGLNPNAPLKPSGIDWLGDIPEHWNCAQLTRISERVVVGIAEAATHAYADAGVPILRSTNVRPGNLVGEILYIDEEYAGDRLSKRIKAGDLVTVRTGNAGVTAVIPRNLAGCQCFTMLITSLQVGSSSEYYCYWMNSTAAQAYFRLEGWGTAQVNISVPILKELSVPLPPAEEQLKIVEFLQSETSRLDSLISESQKATTLLIERREALIAACVTGQIDVRHTAQLAGT